MKHQITIPPLIKRIFKIAIWVLFTNIILIISLSLLLLIPSIQKFITNKAAEIVSEKTNMDMDIGSIHIGFPKDIKIGNLFIADQKSDTLLFCQKLIIDLELIPILRRKINIDYLLIEGLKSNIYKSKSDALFNFSPLIDAFASGNKNKAKSSKTPWNIGFDQIELKNIKAAYRNQIDSSEMLLDLGYLSVAANSVNALEGMFDIEKIELQQTSLSIIIASNKPKQKDTITNMTSAKLPFDINLEEANLENLHFDLATVNGDLSLIVDLQKANILPKLLDLKNTDIELNNINIDGVDVTLQILPNENDSISQQVLIENPKSDNFTFANIPWKILVNHAEISNTSYKMELDSNQRNLEGMDYWHMMFTDINLVADSIFFNKDQTGAKVHELNAKEISGAKLTHMEGKFYMDNNAIITNDIAMATPKSSIAGSASLGYSSLREIGSQIGKLKITSDLHGHIEINEISPFTSVLKQYPMLSKLREIEVDHIKIDGTLDNMTLSNCKAGIGQSTIFQASGHIQGLPYADLFINFDIDTLITTNKDIANYLPDTLLPDNISLPRDIGLSASFNYSPKSMDLIAVLQTELGGLSTNIQLADKQLSSKFDLNAIDVGKIMNDSNTFGKLNMCGQIDTDISVGNFDSYEVKLDVQSIGMHGYLYNNIYIELDREKDNFSFYSNMDDTAISFVAKGEALLDVSNHYNLDINLHHADLKKLKFTDEDFTIKLIADINTNFTSADDIEGSFLLSNMQLSNPRGAYKIAELKLDTDIKKDYTNFKLSNDIFDAALSGNSKIMELKNAFNNHINNYITVPDSLLTEKEYHFDFNLLLKKPDFFTDFLIDDLDEINIKNLTASYDGSSDLFLADINIPRLKYANWEFDSLLFTLNSEGDSIFSAIEMEQVFYDSLYVNNLSLSSKFANQHADLRLSIAGTEDSIQYLIASHAVYTDSAYIINLSSDQLIIDHQLWAVNPENKLTIKNKNISVESASISFENQKVELESDHQNHLKIVFEQFDINNIVGFLKTEEKDQILGGRLDGFIEVSDPLGNPVMKSELEIDDLKLYDNSLGNFISKIKFDPTEKLDYDVKLRNESNKISLVGFSTFETDNLTTSATIIAEITAAESLGVFFNNYVTDLSGGLNGKIEIDGNMDAPELNGKMSFHNLSMIVQPANAQLSANGVINIDANKFEFSNFMLTDSLQNQLTFKGGIDARNIINPYFDIKIHSQDFMAINSKPGKDQVVVGKLFLGIDIDVVGNLSGLKANSKFVVTKKTDIMYIMPGKDLELITDNGIVVFTDFDSQPDTLMTVIHEKFIGDSLISSIKGIDATVNLKIDPEAQFSIYVDPNSGDITYFKLKGNLQYKYNDIQRGYLEGLIELEEGYYDLSFYGLVKKKFIYDPGSTISWSGNVLEGNINFTARFEVKTNSVGLVSNEISSYERSLYNQRLPYEVLLNIDDQISNPLISFAIELPDRYKNDNPTIASKLSTLKQPGMESELNKQVFALLVGGTFIPENPDVNDGSSSSNFATTAARNSVNAIMTQQLNNLTGQFIKGIDVDMGLNTFDDYASGKANTRTQLDVKVSKNLFNNRVSAEVESHIDLEGSNSNPGTQSTAGMTEFAVSYRLTESGNYSIKAFRENAWDIFDGEIQNSGIAFIFVKEFDSFKKKK